ncbi:tRNA 4-thiouridine(8) synthase ThiI [Candidatus Falkowbacteria bacterium]|jgi:tRNA uracil 4-sulfurtransferase|nr:tRNA 4-thiouridine(8) synthase ThiI [Candidatus Falkowbacteria bacterium]MBT5503816.1 tRNA 4-thiouridine(8) synthase ThiI [Candidatus Falkowbacteria bacterium]MBT6573859.1 tRNA 4-thiouridine(8) synthase ThiI [Candidatus Falkowbacteria bacterium]MBT7348549.1 tRNA 4-thiouridine(8) synthase ThiI [Candidatus Falkowbacteria bacterium]MBT7501067.1 tRNA 4-thiouridine(8) synthase ThiI [Candidatus Falkowbacteria bacterium]
MENIFKKIIVHFDEIGLKGKNQPFFVKQVIKNIEQKLGLGVKASRAEGKLQIELPSNADIKKMINLLKFTPGVSTINPGLQCLSEMDQIEKQALAVVDFYKPKTFKIETTRSYKPFELNSLQVSSQVGAYVLQNADFELKVDVHKPELTVKVEVAKRKTFVLGKKEKGLGGLPVGTAGKVICLLSGGLDSPVAGFQMMKRGAEVIFVHFHNQTINKVGVQNKIKKLVTQLSKVQGSCKLIIVPFSDLQKSVIAHIPADVRMIVYRRLMYRIAEQIAVENKVQALVAGDSLAQVASQTMENLQVIYQATSMLKFAPLIGMNKNEIINIAEQIGTYAISIEPYEDCCSLMIAKHPQTRAKLEEVLKVEQNLEVNDLISQAINMSEISEFKAN